MQRVCSFNLARFEALAGETLDGKKFSTGRFCVDGVLRTFKAQIPWFTTFRSQDNEFCRFLQHIFFRER